MKDHGQDLERAFALLRQGKLQEAETRCRDLLARSPQDASAMHLLGLVRRDAGDVAEAERLLRASIEIQPTADSYANLGFLMRRLARLQEADIAFRRAMELDPTHPAAHLGRARTLADQGAHAACEAECRELLRLHPDTAEAWSILGTALQSLNKLTESEQAYRRALALQPQSAANHHNLGALLSQLERSEESLEALRRAQSLGLSGFALSFNLGRTLAQLYHVQEAERAFAIAVSIEPRHAAAQLNLARLRFMQGDPDFARDLESARRAYPRDAELQLLHARILRRTGDLRSAAMQLQNLLLQNKELASARSELAAILYEAGHLPEAEDEALKAATLQPGDADIIETLVSIVLARGRPDEALQFIATQRQRAPYEQRWVAYEATAHRLLSNGAYGELYDYDRLLRVYDLAPPRGWRSMEELNAALVAALESRHKFVSHPLDQSLRNGSQTARSLLTDPHPAIRAVLEAFDASIEDYLRSVGRAPNHPLTARNRGTAVLTGAWSVQLRREGFHVNHVHPQGWISSAYYVAVPAESSDPQLRSGWLKFGETRYPVNGAGPERVVQPMPGRLVLFPSYMWHGTNPIRGNEPRTTIAFDANPGPAAAPGWAR